VAAVGSVAAIWIFADDGSRAVVGEVDGVEGAEQHRAGRALGGQAGEQQGLDVEDHGWRTRCARRSAVLSWRGTPSTL
jgi:hypothetical protein